MTFQQGLYRPEFEHNACGIGHIKRNATHVGVKKRTGYALPTRSSWPTGERFTDR